MVFHCSASTMMHGPINITFSGCLVFLASHCALTLSSFSAKHLKNE